MTRTALASGLLAGVVLEVLTFLLARYGPQAGNWSFRGNGALVVPLGLGPAVLAGAYTALVLRALSRPGWLRHGFGAAGVGAVLIVASSAAVLLFDMSGAVVAQVLILATWLWTVAAPLLGALVARRAGGRCVAGGVHLLAAVVFTVALGAGFYAAGVVIPAGS